VEYRYRGTGTTHGQIGIPAKCASNAPELWMFNQRRQITVTHAA
jgi:hypothetical protein